MGGVDDTVKLAEKGDLKTQLALAAGVDASGSATATSGSCSSESLQERCKELVNR